MGVITHCAFGAVDRINTVVLLKHPLNDPCLLFLLNSKTQLGGFHNVSLIAQRASLITGMG